jgi:hypothetical protein
MNRPLHFLVLAVASSLVACSSDSAGPPPPVGPVTAPAISLDRGSTLAGTDANGDGLRDDVEAVINRFATSEAAKTALRAFGRELQASLLAPATAAAAYDAGARVHAAMTCVGRVLPDAAPLLREVEAVTLNTEQRFRAHLTRSALLAGRAFVDGAQTVCP